MKTVELSASARAGKGTKIANELRRSGDVPAELYGGEENKHIKVNEIEFTKLIDTHEVYFVDLDLDGNKVKTIIKDVQFHPITDKVTHVDFLQVSEDKAVKMALPVMLKGQAIGVINGGKLRLVMRKVRVKGLPDAMPEHIEIDISKLRIGHAIKVADLNLGGLEILEAPNAVIVAVKTSRVAVMDEELEEEEGEEGEEGAAEGEEGSAEGGEKSEGGEEKSED